MVSKFKQYNGADEYRGQSTDVKPVANNDDVFHEIDTGKDFMYNESTGDWKEQPKKGGGGGGVSVVEIDVSTGGDVNQNLEAGKLYHFTGTLTSLTVTLTAPASGELAHYHFDFTTGSTAPTVTIPNTVTMPDSFTVEANKRYEVDILNNYGAVMTWAIS